MKLPLIGGVVAASNGFDLPDAVCNGMHYLVGGGDLRVGDPLVAELCGVS